MPIEVDQLKPYDGAEVVTSNQSGSAVMFDVAGKDTLIIQVYDLDGLGSWPTSLVLTVEASLDSNSFAAFPSGAVTYSAFGLQTALAVSGLSFVRVRVSTVSSAGHGKVGVRANAITEP